MVIHILFEGQTVTINPLACFSGEDEVEVDEALQLFGEVDAFWETEEGDHSKIYLTVLLWIFF